MGKVFKALNKAEVEGDLRTEGAATKQPVSEQVRRPKSPKPIPVQTVSSAPSTHQEKEKPATEQVVFDTAPADVLPTTEATPTDTRGRSEMREVGSWDERLVKATKVSGAIAESIRTLRTRLLHPFMGDIPRKVLITSATPGEGKSFICANLGISLAQGVDHYSLIVDCDLRKPAQHKLFGLANDCGLVNYLREGTDLSELIIKSGVNKLSLIPAGPPPVNPAELLSSGAMISLVNQLAQRYDDRIILLDSPPLQAASETAVLAQNVDAVVLVVRWSASRREHVKALVDLIGRKKIIGVVFNAYKATVLDTKVFGYYEYQQNYYYGDK